MAEITDTEATAETASEIALKYMRHHSPDWTPCDTVQEAVSQAAWMREDGNGWPTEVVSLDGTILLDEAALERRIEQYERNLPPPTYVDPPEIPADDLPAAEAFSRFMGRTRASASDWVYLSDDLKSVWRAKAAEAAQ